DEHVRSAAVVRGIRRLAVFWADGCGAVHRPPDASGRRGHRARAGTSRDDRRVRARRRRHRRQQLFRLPDAVGDWIGDSAARRLRVLRDAAMTFPALAYTPWAKSLPRVPVNLARSGIELAPAALLKLTAADLVANLPVRYGYAPLAEAIAHRYGVRVD